jgi:malate synthase
MVETARVEVKGPIEGRSAEVLTPEALEFIGELQRRFNPTRQQLLARRVERQVRFDAGDKPDCRTVVWRSPARRSARW